MNRVFISNLAKNKNRSLLEYGYWHSRIQTKEALTYQIKFSMFLDLGEAIGRINRRSFRKMISKRLSLKYLILGA